MDTPRFSEDIWPLTELKTKTSKIVEHVRRSRRPVLLTKRGRGVAVLLDLDEYERLVERATFVEAVNEGATAAKFGDLYEHAKAEEILNRFGEGKG